MNVAVKEKSKFSLFVRRKIDNYGLNPYDFWIYPQITRRARNGQAWESLGNIAGAYRIAGACRMALSRARKTLRLLNLAEVTQ